MLERYQPGPLDGDLDNDMGVQPGEEGVVHGLAGAGQAVQVASVELRDGEERKKGSALLCPLRLLFPCLSGGGGWEEVVCRLT